ncbi:MAG TPA: acetate--CoA ligase family protein [Acidimicrobiales bacterium]|nr:acetate--CoA ligase family protein [Acidimicrobiales bacterium]
MTNSSTLSEVESKELLARYGVPLAREQIVTTPLDAVYAAEAIGYPVVAKLNGEGIAHKTERGLVKLNLTSADAVEQASAELLAAARPEDGSVSLLIAQQVRGNRELIAGVLRDAQFGPVVMLGIGGVIAEAVADVAFRLVPLSALDAEELIDDLATQRLLGPFRGEPAVDRGALVAVLLGLSQLALDNDYVMAVDVNPLIVVDGVPTAVDALVEIAATP